MATNTLLLRVNPTPRNLSQSKEIFQRLKQFGEIAMFRQLRHEATTLQMTSEAFVIYKSPEAFRSALEARRLNVQAPAFPATSDQNQQSFDIEITSSDFDHAKKVEADLFRAASILHSSTGDFAPGVSLAFPPDVTPLSGERLDKKVQLATDGGWSTWRNEMKIGGVKDWQSIPAIADAGFLEEAKRSTNSVSSAWGAKKTSRGRDDRSSRQASKETAVGEAVENPTPLPMDKARMEDNSSTIQSSATYTSKPHKALSNLTVDRAQDELNRGHFKFKPPSAVDNTSPESSTNPESSTRPIASDITGRRSQNKIFIRSFRPKENSPAQVSVFSRVPIPPQAAPSTQAPAPAQTQPSDQSSDQSPILMRGAQTINHRVRVHSAQPKPVPERRHTQPKDSGYKMKPRTMDASQSGIKTINLSRWRQPAIRETADASTHPQQPSTVTTQTSSFPVERVQPKGNIQESRMSEGAKQAQMMNASMAAFAAEAAKISQFVQSSPPLSETQAPAPSQQTVTQSLQSANHSKIDNTDSTPQETQASNEVKTEQPSIPNEMASVVEATPTQTASDVKESQATHTSTDVDKSQTAEPSKEESKQEGKGSWWKLW